MWLGVKSASTYTIKRFQTISKEYFDKEITVL